MAKRKSAARKARVESRAAPLSVDWRLVLLSAWLILGAYTALFVNKGWVGHDEGLLGQSAERVLAGQLPQVGFDDPYTGGLSFLNALSFNLFGSRLVSMRLLLFLVFLACVPAMFLLAVRVTRPLIAAAVTAVCVAWTLPNYFAAMPSWYNLFLAVFGALALLRRLDSPRRRWLFVAGACGGLSFLIKLTGVYFIAAGALWLVYREQAPSLDEPRSEGRRSFAFALVLTAAMATVLVVFIRQIGASDLSNMAVIHFLVPPIAICAFLLWNEWRSGTGPLGARLSRTFALQAPFFCGVAVPIALFLIPYAAVEGGLSSFYQGVLVLPGLRLTFATEPLPPLATLVAVVPYGLLLAAVFFRRKPVRFVWVLAFGAVLAIVVARGGEPSVYKAVWYSVRPLAPLVVILGCILLARGTTHGQMPANGRPQLFLMLALTAFMGLTQYPYAYGIYFCYFCPFLVLATLSFVSAPRTPLGGLHLCALAFYFLFAVAWDNTGTIRALGVEHRPVENTEPLLPDRAGLSITADHAKVYSELVAMIEEHGTGSPYIYAGPDSPEIYFLSRKLSPLRTMYEFFDTSGQLPQKILDAVQEKNVGVVVINPIPEFSPPPDLKLYARLRELYPHAARVGSFVVLWKK